MDNSRNKLQYCILTYSILLCFIVFIVFTFQTKNKYFRWGVPNNDEEPLIIISVKIDDYYKYTGLLFFIAIFRIIKVIVTEIAEPILAFTIYNPDKKKIDNFSKNELQFYGNTLYFIDSIRYVFTIMLAVTQIDIALFDALIGELTTVFTIRMLLNEKTFNNSEYINIENGDLEETELDIEL
tara:strand:+ start:180 stop:725 length:546 start_codon:yes stop_codon:yes gene_type:complete